MMMLVVFVVSEFPPVEGNHHVYVSYQPPLIIILSRATKDIMLAAYCDGAKKAWDPSRGYIVV